VYVTDARPFARADPPPARLPLAVGVGQHDGEHEQVRTERGRRAAHSLAAASRHLDLVARRALWSIACRRALPRLAAVPSRRCRGRGRARAVRTTFEDLVAPSASRWRRPRSPRSCASAKTPSSRSSSASSPTTATSDARAACPDRRRRVLPARPALPHHRRRPPRRRDPMDETWAYDRAAALVIVPLKTTVAPQKLPPKVPTWWPTGDHRHPPSLMTDADGFVVRERSLHFDSRYEREPNCPTPPRRRR
jgi:hypothetical protein